MRPIDADKLMRYLNDWWLSETPRHTDDLQVKFKQALICKTIETAMEAIRNQPELTLDDVRRG